MPQHHRLQLGGSARVLPLKGQLSYQTEQPVWGNRFASLPGIAGQGKDGSLVSPSICSSCSSKGTSNFPQISSGATECHMLLQSLWCPFGSDSTLSHSPKLVFLPSTSQPQADAHQWPLKSTCHKQCCIWRPGSDACGHIRPTEEEAEGGECAPSLVMT
jgi:hypothetical protein